MAGDRRQAAGVRGRRQRSGDTFVGTAEANLRGAFALVATLNRAGVDHFVVSSGGRSAPLALAVSQLDSACVWAQVDERSAGFWAFGIGQALRRPAALICTSGTAAANYYPAVIEARYSRVPLIVLSADRPPRLRYCGAPQTIDQVHLYAQYPLLFRDLPVPEGESDDLRIWMEAAAYAVAVAAGSPGGPVHLNVPFDEPLLPLPQAVADIVSEIERRLPPVVSKPAEAQGAGSAPVATWDRVADAVGQAARPLIVVGPQNDHDDFATDIGALAEKIGAPILADVASQVRYGCTPETGVIAHYDLCLRHTGTVAELVPDCVLRFGGLPTSKALNEWLGGQAGLRYIAVACGADPADPFGCVTDAVTSDLRDACRELQARLPQAVSPGSSYRDRWLRTDAAVRQVVLSARSDRSATECFEGDCVAFACKTAPAGTAIYLANSMPIRMADMFAEADQVPKRVFVNRGANGIDGIISSAGGAAAALGCPVTLVIGDLAFQHDLNGLGGVSQQCLPLKIVLINNDGGGIFSFLSLSEHLNTLESLVAMPHGRDFSRAAEFYGIPYQRVQTLAEFESAYGGCFAPDGPAIVEVRTNRAHTRSTMDAVIRKIARQAEEKR